MNKRLKALTALQTIWIVYTYNPFRFRVIHVDMYDHDKKLIAKVYGNPGPNPHVFNHMSHFTIPVDDDCLCKCGDERSCCIHSLFKIGAKTRYIHVTTEDGSIYEIPILAWRGGNPPKKKIYDSGVKCEYPEYVPVTGRKGEINE